MRPASRQRVRQVSWINGVAGRCVDYRDRGLQYGDGLFETMRVRRGRVRLLEFHLERLFEGCRRMSSTRTPSFSICPTTTLCCTL